MEPLRIGLIRPPETSTSSAFRTLLTELVDDDEGAEVTKDGSMLMDETTDKLLSDLRTITEEVADDIRVRIRLREYQVHDRTGNEIIFGSKNMTDFLENDLLLALDPSEPQSSAMLRGTSINPRQRVVVAFSSKDDLFDRGRFLSMRKFPILEEIPRETRTALQGVFLLHLSPNDDQRAIEYQHSKSIVAEAFHYPFSRTIEVENDRYTKLHLL